MFQTILTFALLTISFGNAQRLELVVTNTKLPSGRYHMPTLYDGDDSIYILGGQSTANGFWVYDIVKYSISEGTVETIGEMAKTGGGSGLLIGNGNFFYFGGTGSSPSDPVSEIWNFKLSDPSNWTVVGNFPQGRHWGKGLWDEGVEGNVYIVGGGQQGQFISNIISKFSTLTYAVEEVVAELPTGRVLTSAVFDKETKNSYIFGGMNSGFAGIADVLKFDTVAKTVTKLNVDLPATVLDSCAIWNGVEAYNIGGWFTDLNASPITSFNPEKNEVTSYQIDDFPSNLQGPGCVYVEKLNRVYILGGVSAGLVRDEIMYIDLGSAKST